MSSITRTVSFIVIAICGLLGLWYFLNPLFQPPQLVLNNATVVASQHALTDFNLVDTNNQPFTQHNLRGHWTLMFFGYTDCPDICPSTLNVMRATWDSFTNDKPAKFIFASINPKSDPPETLKKFLGRFHPDFVGITGNGNAVKQLSDQLGVFAKRSDEVYDDVAANTADSAISATANNITLATDTAASMAEPTIIDHTAALMLINPHGKLHAIFTPPLSPQDLAQDLVAITKASTSILKK